MVSTQVQCGRKSPIQELDVVVAGAGAAGLMCAIEAGRRGRRILLIEHTDAIGKKIRISGGGRCNFTNVNAAPEHFVSQNPRFATSALSRFRPADVIALVEKHRIPYYEKKLGQLFCRGSAEPFIRMLQTECDRANVEVRLNCRICSASRDKRFLIETNAGDFACESFVVATGGLSIPKIGATDFGHRIARQFGHGITELRPALVPLTFTPEDLARFGDLAGIALDASVECNGMAFRENVLFTHRGMSGPAILQISTYWNEGDALTVDFLPGMNLRQWMTDHKRSGTKAEFATLLRDHLPERFVRRWCELYAPSRPLPHFGARQIADAAEAFHRWRFVPEGTEGYRKAEVTRGGVDTRELSPQTMESRKVKGLYFIGEVVDVTGWLGGYNFQWAWASGHAAGQAV